MMIHLQLQWIKVYTDLQATGNGFLEIGRTVLVERLDMLDIFQQLQFVFVVCVMAMFRLLEIRLFTFRNFGAKNPNPVDFRPKAK
jgi:hypothetical protein